MSVSNLIKKRIYSLRKSNPDISFYELSVKGAKGIFDVLLAKVYLRRCTELGKMVSVNGKPMIENQGYMKLENEVRVWSNIERTKLLTGPEGKLIIGENSRINGAHIDAQKCITIGKNVRIAPYCLIMDSDYHDIFSHFEKGIAKEIVIEDDVWLTSKVTVLKGVKIGKGAVVGCGAVVTKDVPSYTVVAGVPAKVVKKLK